MGLLNLFMSSYSLFDIAGPVMIGPSSSHTAGAAKLGLVARALLGEQPENAKLFLHGSFGEVYMGHATDRALVSGLLGFSPDDARLKNAFGIAKECGLAYEFIKKNLGKSLHPNTVLFDLAVGDKQLTMMGSSVGGGMIEISQIDGIDLNLSAGLLRDNALIIWHHYDYHLPAVIEKIVDGKTHISYQHSWRSRKDIARTITLLNFKTALPADLKSKFDALDVVERSVYFK